MRAVLALPFLVTVVLVLAKPDPLTIHVLPSVLFEGRAVRITCRVGREDANRAITLAVEGYRYSTQPIDGENGPVTFTLQADHVPCGVDLATCVVARLAQRALSVQSPITVVGC